jgi:lipoprotein-anchoring transpeptidase ErfK/SrfK
LTPVDFSSLDQTLRLEIRLSRRQVSLYKGEKLVKIFPIAVGKPGWETPKGTFQVKQMFRDPAWVHPLERGVMIPGGDPDNPLGRYWIGFWTDGKNWIGFHGTPNPKSVGTAASHGCIRMYNKDIEELFQIVSLGTEVKVVQ